MNVIVMNTYRCAVCTLKESIHDSIVNSLNCLYFWPLMHIINLSLLPMDLELNKHFSYGNAICLTIKGFIKDFFVWGVERAPNLALSPVSLL